MTSLLGPCSTFFSSVSSWMPSVLMIFRASCSIGCSALSKLSSQFVRVGIIMNFSKSLFSLSTLDSSEGSSLEYDRTWMMSLFWTISMGEFLLLRFGTILELFIRELLRANVFIWLWIGITVVADDNDALVSNGFLNFSTGTLLYFFV